MKSKRSGGRRKSIIESIEYRRKLSVYSESPQRRRRNRSALWMAFLWRGRVVQESEFRRTTSCRNRKRYELDKVQYPKRFVWRMTTKRNKKNERYTEVAEEGEAVSTARGGQLFKQSGSFSSRIFFFKCGATATHTTRCLSFGCNAQVFRTARPKKKKKKKWPVPGWLPLHAPPPLQLAGRLSLSHPD